MKCVENGPYALQLEEREFLANVSVKLTDTVLWMFILIFLFHVD